MNVDLPVFVVYDTPDFQSGSPQFEFQKRIDVISESEGNIIGLKRELHFSPF